MKCKHQGTRIVSGHKTVCETCGYVIADADPRIVALVDELYARPSAEVAAAFIMDNIRRAQGR